MGKNYPKNVSSKFYSFEFIFFWTRNPGQPIKGSKDSEFGLNSFASSMFQEFRAKTSGSHVALCECNSGAENNRERLKRLGKSSTLIEKNIFGWGLQIFCE